MRITKKDLRARVGELNKEFKKTEKTLVKLDILEAYGGNQVVIRNRRGGGVRSITNGYKSARETLDELNYKKVYLKKDLDFATKSESSYLKDLRRRKAISSYYSKKKK